MQIMSDRDHYGYDYRWFLDMCKRISFDSGRAEKSVGTLGGGK